MHTVVSLFSGCGGLDWGFKEAGFDLIYACDNDQYAVDTYLRNIDHRVYRRDVTSSEFHTEISEIGQCDVVLGGFPCQGFSKAGPKTASDPRNTLYLEMLRTVRTLQPQVFIAENVDGMSQNFGGEFVQRILHDFRSVGYDVEHRIIQAADYGVPQHRRRILFVGIRKNRALKFKWPKTSHVAPLRNGEFKVDYGDCNAADESRGAPRTIADAIGDLLDTPLGTVQDHLVVQNWSVEDEHIFRAIAPGQKLCNVRHASSSVYTWDIPEVYGAVTPKQRMVLEAISKNRRHKKYGSVPNGNPLSLEVIQDLTGLGSANRDIQSLVKKGYLKVIDGKYDLRGAMFCSGLYKRPEWNKPAPTVLTVFDSPRYFLHPLRNRPFTVRECARLQSFPDSFVFCPKTTATDLKAAYRLIGNAVPPLLGRQLAHAVQNTLASVSSAAITKDLEHEAANTYQ